MANRGRMKSFCAKAFANVELFEKSYDDFDDNDNDNDESIESSDNDVSVLSSMKAKKFTDEEMKQFEKMDKLKTIEEVESDIQEMQEYLDDLKGNVCYPLSVKKSQLQKIDKNMNETNEQEELDRLNKNKEKLKDELEVLETKFSNNDFENLYKIVKRRLKAANLENEYGNKLEKMHQNYEKIKRSTLQIY